MYNAICQKYARKVNIFVSRASFHQKLQDFNDELDVKEKERLMEQMKIQNDNKSTTELLKSKIENLKEELSQAFAKVVLLCVNLRINIMTYLIYYP